MEIERLSLCNSVGIIQIPVAGLPDRDANVFHSAVNFIRRRVKDGRLRSGFSDRFKNVERPKRVDFEILARIDDRRRNRDLRREMRDNVRLPDFFFEFIRVAYIANDEPERVRSEFAIQPVNILLLCF